MGRQSPHPEEGLLHQGWSDGAVVSTLGVKVPHWPEHLLVGRQKAKAVLEDQPDECDVLDEAQSLAPLAKKQRRVTRPVNYCTVLVDLVGNMMSAPDLVLMLYTMELSCDSDLFEHNLPEDISGFLDLPADLDTGCVFEVGRSSVGDAVRRFRAGECDSAAVDDDESLLGDD